MSLRKRSFFVSGVADTQGTDVPDDTDDTDDFEIEMKKSMPYLLERGCRTMYGSPFPNEALFFCQYGKGKDTGLLSAGGEEAGNGTAAGFDSQGRLQMVLDVSTAAIAIGDGHRRLLHLHAGTGGVFRLIGEADPDIAILLHTGAVSHNIGGLSQGL